MRLVIQQRDDGLHFFVSTHLTKIKTSDKTKSLQVSLQPLMRNNTSTVIFLPSAVSQREINHWSVRPGKHTALKRQPSLEELTAFIPCSAKYLSFARRLIR